MVSGILFLEWELQEATDCNLEWQPEGKTELCIEAPMSDDGRDEESALKTYKPSRSSALPIIFEWLWVKNNGQIRALKSALTEMRLKQNPGTK